MELQAAIEALSALKEPCEVEFHTDSEYVKNGVSRWLSNWKRNGWRTKSKKPVKTKTFGVRLILMLPSTKWNGTG